MQQTTYRATVEVTKSLSMSLMPVYAEPTRTDDLSDNWLYDTNQQVVFSNRENSRGRKYSFDYVRSTYTPEALRAAQPLPADHPVRRQMTATPGPVPEVEELVKGLIQGKRTDYDKVLAIYRHFSADNGFSYRLSTESGSSGQDIVNFLTNKVGYCQQYAAAMAWLVRAAGIPARVAFGFTNGSKRDGDTFTLTNLNLHAWTEVYFDGLGWVPFDATPAYGVPGSTRSAWAPDTDAPEATQPEHAAPRSAPTDPERLDRRRPARTTPTGTPTKGWPSAERRRTSSHRSGPGGRRAWWPCWCCSRCPPCAGWRCAADAVAARRARRWPPPLSTAAASRGHVRWWSPRTPTGPARTRTPPGRSCSTRWWTSGSRSIRPRRPGRPRTGWSGTPSTTTTPIGSARLLGRAEERARYARDPLTGERLLPALRAVRGALAARADRRTRLLAAVLPPSVLLRWRTAMADTSGRMVALTGRTRYRLLRWNPRRLLADRAAR